jgi:hypothetical protein
MVLNCFLSYIYIYIEIIFFIFNIKILTQSKNIKEFNFFSKHFTSAKTNKTKNLFRKPINL